MRYHLLYINRKIYVNPRALTVLFHNLGILEQQVKPHAFGSDIRLHGDSLSFLVDGDDMMPNYKTILSKKIHFFSVFVAENRKKFPIYKAWKQKKSSYCQGLSKRTRSLY